MSIVLPVLGIMLTATRIVQPHEAGTINGVMAQFRFLGSAIGPQMFTQIYEHFGARMPWLVLMVTQAVIAFLFVVLPRQGNATISSQDIPVPDALARLPMMGASGSMLFGQSSLTLDGAGLQRACTVPAFS